MSRFHSVERCYLVPTFYASCICHATLIWKMFTDDHMIVVRSAVGSFAPCVPLTATKVALHSFRGVALRGLHTTYEPSKPMMVKVWHWILSKPCDFFLKACGPAARLVRHFAVVSRCHRARQSSSEMKTRDFPSFETYQRVVEELAMNLSARCRFCRGATPYI